MQCTVYKYEKNENENKSNKKKYSTHHFSLNYPNYLKRKQINDIRTPKTLDASSFHSIVLLLNEWL